MQYQILTKASKNRAGHFSNRAGHPLVMGNFSPPYKQEIAHLTF